MSHTTTVGQRIALVPDLFRQGYSYCEIRKITGLSYPTVKKHRPKDIPTLKSGRKPTITTEQVLELKKQGKTFAKIAKILHCSERTARVFFPKELRRKHKPESAPRNATKAWFPVHPEVVEAKETLCRVFQVRPFSPKDYAKCITRLKYLLKKHHPKESRPSEQVDALARARRHKTKAGALTTA